MGTQWLGGMLLRRHREMFEQRSLLTAAKQSRQSYPGGGFIQTLARKYCTFPSFLCSINATDAVLLLSRTLWAWASEHRSVKLLISHNPSRFFHGTFPSSNSPNFFFTSSTKFSPSSFPLLLRILFVQACFIVWVRQKN